jgi:hypothetical protein
MTDTPLGTPIPIGLIESRVDDNHPPAPMLSEIGKISERGDLVSTSLRTADGLMLAPMKFGLAAMLATAAFACNPFFATSRYKHVSSDPA